MSKVMTRVCFQILKWIKNYSGSSEKETKLKSSIPEQQQQN